MIALYDILNQYGIAVSAESARALEGYRDLLIDWKRAWI